MLKALWTVVTLCGACLEAGPEYVSRGWSCLFPEQVLVAQVCSIGENSLS